MPFQPGEILLDKYRLEALIGRGAFAEIYRVTDLALNMPRALKVVRRDAPGLGGSGLSLKRIIISTSAPIARR